MVTILAALATLTLLIFVHELGHFAVAKWVGVRVERFSIGFGPALIERHWGGTDYRIAAIPFGGYVKMFGETPDVPVSPEERGVSFTHKPVGQRMAVIFAGLMPIMLGHGTGSEVMRRIAAPMVGGMVSATLLTLALIPAIFLLWQRRLLRKNADQTS